MSSFIHSKFIIDLKEQAEAEVSKKAGVSIRIINSRSKQQSVVHYRNLTWLFLSKKKHLSSITIGQMYGYDHSTVLHGIKRAISTGASKELGISC